MVRRQPLAFRRQQLGPELLALRNAAGLSQDTVRARTDIDPSTLTALENGRRTPQRRTLTLLLDCYGVADEGQRSRLARLIKPVSSPEWLHVYDDDDAVTEALRDLVVLESHAARIRNYPGQFLPGLLHTRDYAGPAIAGAFPRLTPGQVVRLVEVRMRRQQAITEAVTFSAVIDEAALYREVGGPDVTRAQLRRLIDPQPNVTLRVIPYSAGAHPGMSGGFTLMEFRDRDFAPVVYVDSMDGDLLREEPDRVTRFAEMYESLETATLSVADSAALIERVIDKIGR